MPGFIPTEGTDESRLTLPRGEFIPIGRVGTSSHEMGAVAVFLASGASDYMNGEAFIIDGGGLAGGAAPTGHAPEIPLWSSDSESLARQTSRRKMSIPNEWDLTGKKGNNHC